MDLKEAQLSKRNYASRHPWELARLEVIYSFLVKILETTNFSELTIQILSSVLFSINSTSKFLVYQRTPYAKSLSNILYAKYIFDHNQA